MTTSVLSSLEPWPTVTVQSYRSVVVITVLVLCDDALWLNASLFLLIKIINTIF